MLSKWENALSSRLEQISKQIFLSDSAWNHSRKRAKCTSATQACNERVDGASVGQATGQHTEPTKKQQNNMGTVSLYFGWQKSSIAEYYKQD